MDWQLDPDPRLVGEGIARFLDPADGNRPLAPSLALVRTPGPIAPLPGAWRTTPRFARTHDAAEGDERVVWVPVPEGTSLYGTGEIAGPLLRNGARTICWNHDASDYTDSNQSLYQSHPWVLAVRPDGSAFGVLADTTFRVEIDLTSDIRFEVPVHAAPFPIYIIEADSAQLVVTALSDLTGRMPLPPRWALGYQQSRWSYDSQEEALAIAKEFRHRRIPCDVIWLDIDYMDGFRCFTFDHVRFPRPAEFNKQLHEIGLKSVWMIDPGIKLDEHYSIYKSGRDGDNFVKHPDASEYHGTVWPGPCAFPDYTRAETRRWWGALYKDFLAQGVDGVWNDMNEPACFDNPGKQVPENLVHRADETLGGQDSHRRYHNVYGMLMTRATREGMLAARPDKRPFVLTRANYIGGQRYAATWTGDNTSNWDHLAWSIPMALNLALSGQPFAGPDIGGFAGNADAKLFARWMGIGALLPFARGHSIKNSLPHEPWAFGPECEATCRRAIGRRYRLLPYLYTLFQEASASGLPIVRPVFFADPTNPALRAVDDCFLLGEDILVRAQVDPDKPCTSPIPTGAWRAFEPCPTESGAPDPELPDLRFRAGSIVPLGPITQHDGELPLDPLTLVITPDREGSAEGRLYEDHGDGHAHADGHFRRSTYRAQRRGQTLVIAPPRVDGRLHAPSRVLEVVVLLPERTIRFAGRDGHEIVAPLE